MATPSQPDPRPESETVRYEIEDGVAWVYFNRPDKRNCMSPKLNRLEDARLIERAPIDRKSLGLDLTEPGRELLARARQVVESFEAELLARVPPEHRPHLLPALEALWR